jgi:hypothetical protein
VYHISLFWIWPHKNNHNNDSSVLEGTGFVVVSKTSLSQFKKKPTWETALLKETVLITRIPGILNFKHIWLF